MPRKASTVSVAESLLEELNRQLQNLVSLTQHKTAEFESDKFHEVTVKLKKILSQSELAESALSRERISFVLVLKSTVLEPVKAIEQVKLNGKSGFTTMEADDLKKFSPIGSLEIPKGTAYLLLDVDTGRDLLNVTPNDALKIINKRGRSPLTLDEGLALVLQFPEVLKTKNCFSLLGSRCGDKRVTALWISEKRPRLGWCWAGNPHTWLGSASCGERVGL